MPISRIMECNECGDGLDLSLETGNVVALMNDRGWYCTGVQLSKDGKVTEVRAICARCFSFLPKRAS